MAEDNTPNVEPEEFDLDTAETGSQQGPSAPQGAAAPQSGDDETDDAMDAIARDIGDDATPPGENIASFGAVHTGSRDDREPTSGDLPVEGRNVAGPDVGRSGTPRNEQDDPQGPQTGEVPRGDREPADTPAQSAVPNPPIPEVDPNLDDDPLPQPDVNPPAGQQQASSNAAAQAAQQAQPGTPPTQQPPTDETDGEQPTDETEDDGGTTDGGTTTAPASVPGLTVTGTQGVEDTAIPLDLTSLQGGTGTLTVTIGGLPEGATLSAGTQNPDGTWTLTADQLNGLTITPPTNFSGTFDLTVTATSTGTAGDTASLNATVGVAVEAVADAPTLGATATAGNEDTAVAVDITSALTDTDGSEVLSLTITGVPDGATLSAGTRNADGSWTLTPDQLPGLTLTPPAGFSGTIDLGVTSTSTEQSNGDAASVSTTVSVSFAAVADAPTLAVSAASGPEDTAIGLDVRAALTDTDGSELLSITISGVPDGATLSAGTRNGDGTWTLTPAQLSGLAFTPPQNSDVDVTLTVTATSREANGSTATTTAQLPVTVEAVADAPTLSASATTGAEDTAVAVNIASALTDTDGSEFLTLTISGVPNGATLSAGTRNSDGTWTLTPDQLPNLTMTAPQGFSGTVTLGVTSTSTEQSNNDSESVSTTVSVTFTPVADAPTVTTTAASGPEDTAIPLTIGATLNDTDGSETLSIVISGVPTGAVLSAGTDNGDGTWSLTPDQLAGLTFTPPLHSDGDVTLTVTATAREASGEIATTTSTVPVTVTAVADAPTLGGPANTPLEVNEDTALPLDITSALVDADGSETLSITISGVPTGAVLSAGTNNGDGSWTLTSGDLTGLTITPPANQDSDFTLTVTAKTVEAENGDTATTGPLSIPIVVRAVTDGGDFTVAPATGKEDTAIALDIDPSYLDGDGSEVASVTISDVPTGAVLSAGTQNADGSWTLTAQQLAGLTITPPANSDDDFTLSVQVSFQDGTEGAVVTAAAKPLAVTVTPVADTPNLAAAQPALTVQEDTPIDLGLTSSLNDSTNETLSVAISDVPQGAQLGYVDGNGVFTGLDASYQTATAGDGSTTWTVTQAMLNGLSIKPPANSDVDFSVTVTSTATETNTAADPSEQTAATSLTIPITVQAVTDGGTVTAGPAQGLEDTAISLNVTTAVPDADEVVNAVIISAVPNGATLSNGFVDQGGGVWRLEVGSADPQVVATALSGLTVTPPPNSDTNFTLQVAVEVQDGPEGAAVTSAATPLPVTVFWDADAPTLTGPDGGTADTHTTAEDTPVHLDLSAALTDSTNEVLSVRIDAVDGGSLGTMVGGVFTALAPTGTSGGQPYWTVTADVLDDLYFVNPANDAGSYRLNVTATSTETGGGEGDSNDPALQSESTGRTVTITVTPEAQAADMTTSVGPAVGTEDTAIALNITFTSADTDGSEVLTVTIAGVPDGASLSAGTDNGNGTWTLTQAQLAGLKITPPDDSDDEIPLQVTFTAQDHDDAGNPVGTAYTTTQPLTVTVKSDADVPEIDTARVSPSETGPFLEDGGPVALDITGHLTDDTNESLTFRIELAEGSPDTHLIYTDANNVQHDVRAGDGALVLTPAEAATLQVSPASDWHGTVKLNVTPIATEANDDGNGLAVENGATQQITLAFQAVADENFTFSAPDTRSASESDAETTIIIPLNLSGSLGDTVSAGSSTSERFSLTFDALPEGISIVKNNGGNWGSQLVENADGTWTLNGLSTSDLGRVRLKATEDFSGNFNVRVTAQVYENDGGDRSDTTITETIAVTVHPNADEATGTAQGSGVEDQGPYDVAISITLGDADGSETIDGPIVIELTNDAAKDATWTLDGNPLTVTTTNGVTTITIPNDAAHVQVDPTDPSKITVVGLQVTPKNTDLADAQNDFAGTIGIRVTGTVLDTNPSDANDTNTENFGFDGSITITPDTDDSVVITGTARGVEDREVDGSTPHIGAQVSLSTVQVQFQDDDRSEQVQSVVIEGVPDGWNLSNATQGAQAADGTWTWTVDLTAVQGNDRAADFDLSQVVITLPQHESADGGAFPAQTLTVHVTHHDPGDPGSAHTNTQNLTVEVQAVADVPTVVVSAARGLEDQPIDLDIRPSLVDTDGSETLAVDISDIPVGAQIYVDGQSVFTATSGNQTYRVQSGDLDTVAIKPPSDSNDDFTLQITPVSRETSNGDEASGQAVALDVTVRGDADAPVVVDTTATGTEDQSGGIALNLNQKVVLGDDDTLNTVNPSEVLSAVIGKLPAGFTLSEGQFNPDGSWSLTPDQLATVKLIAPKDYSGTVQLTVKAVATERFDDDGTPGTGDVATTTFTLDVDVTPVVDTPSGYAGASGNEDEFITLNVNPNPSDGDGSESWTSVTISDIPAGATLRYTDASGNPAEQTFSATGSITLTPAQVGNLAIKAPLDSNVDFVLSVSTTVVDTATDHNGDPMTDTRTYDGTITVDVRGVADQPTVEATTGAQTGSWVAVSISGASGEHVDAGSGTTDGSESLHYVITGANGAALPDGLMLSDGYNNGDGTWTLSEAQLAGLQVKLPSGTSTLDLQVQVIAVENDGDTNIGETPVTDTFTVTVSGGGTGGPGGGPILGTVEVPEHEGEQIGDHLAAKAGSFGTATDVTISGIPAGATVSMQNGASYTANPDGSITVATADLGNLVITRAGHEADDYDLTVSWTDGGTPQSDTLHVDMRPVADAPTVGVTDGSGATPISGAEDTAIPVQVTVSLVDTDGSEVRYLVIDDLPTGATISSAGAFINPNGSWTIPVDPQAMGSTATISVTPPNDFSGDMTFTVRGVAMETENGDDAVTEQTVHVTVTPVVDAPSVSTSISAVDEDAPSRLGLAVTANDTTETVTQIIVKGLPTDFSLTDANGDPVGVDLGGGQWDVTGLTSADLAGLQVVPKEHYSGSVNITIDVTVTDDDGVNSATQTTSHGVSLTFRPVTDAGTIDAGTVTGTEDEVGGVALTGLVAQLTDADGSEAISVSISGIPEGGMLSAGTNNGDGSWTLTNLSELANLKFFPPENMSGDVSLTLNVSTMEKATGDIVSVSKSFTVSLTADADTPDLVVWQDTYSTDEDVPVSLTLSAGLVDTSETLTVTLSGVPDGASFNMGQAGATPGTWVIELGSGATVGTLDGLTFTPPPQGSGTYAMTVTATTADGTDVASVSDTLTVTVAPVVDAPQLDPQTSTGTEDGWTTLDLQAGLQDMDGSETLTLTFGNLPDGAQLRVGGVDVAGTTITLTATQLQQIADGTMDPVQIYLGDDVSGSFPGIQVTATATETATGDTSVTATKTFTVEVLGTADAPDVDIPGGTLTGVENDASVPLNLDTAISLSDASETLTVTISGVGDATLSAGHDNGDGTWTLTQADLAGLKFVSGDANGSWTLTVTATSTEQTPDPNGPASADTTGTIQIAIEARPDAPTLVFQSSLTGSVAEDANGGQFTLTVGADLAAVDLGNDDVTSLEVVITGLPDGALVDGQAAVNGAWTVVEADFGTLTVQLPDNYDGSFTPHAEARAIQGEHVATTSSTLPQVEVTPVADAPIVSGGDATLDAPAPVDLGLAVTVVDASETLSITVTADGGTVTRADGSTVASGDNVALADVPGLKFTPPDGAADGSQFHVVLTATSTESDGSTADTSATVTIAVAVDDQSGDTSAAITGTLIDPYISGATVFLDLDGDGQLDADEPSTVTDAMGGYSFEGLDADAVAGAQLVAFGGVDTGTGLPLDGVLTGQAGGTITPLTTLMQAAIQDGLADSGEDTQAWVAEVMNLPLTGIDLADYDPVAQAAAGDPVGAEVLRAGMMVQTTVSMLTSAIEAAGVDPQAGTPLVMQSVVEALDAGGIAGLTAGATGLTQSLADTLVSEGLIEGEQAGLFDAVTGAIADTNQAFLDQSGSGAELIEDLAATARSGVSAADQALEDWSQTATAEEPEETAEQLAAEPDALDEAPDQDVTEDAPAEEALAEDTPDEVEAQGDADADTDADADASADTGEEAPLSWDAFLTSDDAAVGSDGGATGGDAAVPDTGSEVADGDSWDAFLSPDAPQADGTAFAEQALEVDSVSQDGSFDGSGVLDGGDVAGGDALGGLSTDVSVGDAVLPDSVDGGHDHSLGLHNVA